MTTIHRTTANMVALLQQQAIRAVNNLRQKLAPQTVERLLGLLILQQDRLFISHYSSNGPITLNGRKYMYPGLKDSPIIVGDLRDLSYYQITAVHPDFPGRPAQTLSYLDKYLLIPTRSGQLIFVSDTHNHALFGWALSREIGLTDRQTAIVHVDAHYDESIPGFSARTQVADLSEEALVYINKPGHRAYFRFDQASGGLETSAAAIDLQLLRDYHCASPEERQAINQLYEQRLAWDRGYPQRGDSLEDYAAWSRAYADICSFISPAEGRLFQDLFYVLTMDNGLGTDSRRSDFHGMRQGGQLVSIELMQDRVRQLKAQGQKVIVDLDLDYFAHYSQEEVDSGREAKERISFEDNFAQVLALAREADFITVATSPDWFADQTGKVREILERFVTALR